MYAASPDQGLTVQRARLRGGGAYARPMLEAALAPIDPTRLGLSRRAVLIVRRLTAATPLGRPGFAPAVEAALRGSLARAARPARDGGAAAEALLFEDEAELAAWLIGGRTRNDPPAARWWWPAVLRGRPPAAWWRAELLPRGDLLPRVIGQLAEVGLAEAWLADLDADDLGLALGAIVHAHALAPGCEGRVEIGRPGPPTRPAPPALVLRDLLRKVPELAASRLAPPARRLLAVALTVRRDAALARRPDFAIALDALETRLAAPRTALIAPPLGIDAPPKAARQVPAPERKTPTSKTPPRSPPSRPDLAPDPPRAIHRRRAARPGAVAAPWKEGLDARFGETPSNPAPRPPALEPEADPCLVRAPAPTRASDQTPDVASPSLDESATPLRHVTTDFGGVFYLLNALLGLELYSDFSQPRGRNLAMSPWDLLAMLGDRWFGAAFKADAISDVLARLAGRRPNARPGAGFVPPATWITPRAWLTPWGSSGEIIGWIGRRRLVLWHPAGFVIAEAPRKPGRGGHAQLASLARQAGLSARPITTVTRAPVRLGRGRGRWLSLLDLYLQARLARALGVAPRDAPGLLCRSPALLALSEDRLDIRLALSDLPLSVRIAGLDRDPGWIPAAGLKPVFHFQ